MLKHLHIALIIVLTACQAMTTKVVSQYTRWSPEHVYYGWQGKLVYTPDEKGNVIPDFSHVGYMYGDEAIPDVQVVVEVSPVEGDDRENIQAAINQVQGMPPDTNGFRGAVLLKKGTYQVKGQLYIRASGVVLKGEGMTNEGTVVVADGTGKRDFIVIGNGSGRKDDLGSKVNISEDYVPLGRRYVVVDDASGYNTGDEIAIYRPGTANWISDLRMDQIPNPDGATKQWKPSSYSFYFERLVTKVSADTIFFRNPVVMAMDSMYGGGSVNKCTSDRIQKVGVENLCLKSAFASDNDEDHAWVGIKFNAVEHAWAKGVTSWYFGYACTSIDKAARLVTVENCHCRKPKSMISGGRRYSFNVGGSMNLVRDCSADEGRHDFVTGSRVRGPNVFTNCTVTNTFADAGPHHRWAMGTLYDIVVTDGSINVQDRGASGSGHGWAGANQVFWNCKGASSICQSPWVSAKNYNFGFMGEKNSGRYARPDGVWVGHQQTGLFPESLYQAQLDARIKDVRIFAVYPTLKKVNDSSFVLSFNMPFNDQLADPDNFSVGGDAGFTGKAFSVNVLSDTSVMLVFDGIGLLRAYSSLIVHAKNILNTSGKALEGMTFATYIEPDLTPVVSGVTATVNNEDGTLEASSSRPGSIYLIKFNEDEYYFNPYQSISGLDQAVMDNLGRKVNAPVANTTVSIPTKGLPGGYYLYYAADGDGRVSAPANEWPQVVQTGPLLGMDNVVMVPEFSAWSSHGTIFIQPDDPSAKYSARICDITGRIIHSSESMTGEQQLTIREALGILIVHLVSESGLRVGTYKLLNNYQLP